MIIAQSIIRLSAEAPLFIPAHLRGEPLSWFLNVAESIGFFTVYHELDRLKAEMPDSDWIVFLDARPVFMAVHLWQWIDLPEASSVLHIASPCDADGSFAAFDTVQRAKAAFPGYQTFTFDPSDSFRNELKRWGYRSGKLAAVAAELGISVVGRSDRPPKQLSEVRHK